MELLKVENLCFHYEKELVLDRVCFSLEAGDFLGVIGENGTGKTTLMKIILGLLPYDSGKITLFGQDRRQFRDLEKIGYVSQKANSFNSAFPTTVEEVVAANLHTGLRLFGRRPAEQQTRVERALAAVGISDLKNRMIGQLSGGQQQRVFIARTLVNRPELLFLDEPTVGVDARSVTAITALLQDLNRQGITMVMTNHDTHALKAVANKILILSEDGRARLEVNN